MLVNNNHVIHEPNGNGEEKGARKKAKECPKVCSVEQHQSMAAKTSGFLPAYPEE